MYISESFPQLLQNVDELQRKAAPIKGKTIPDCNLAVVTMKVISSCIVTQLQPFVLQLDRPVGVLLGPVTASDSDFTAGLKPVQKANCQTDPTVMPWIISVIWLPVASSSSPLCFGTVEGVLIPFSLLQVAF